MGSKAVDQPALTSKTDVISAHDQSFAVSEDGRPVPWARGERKIAGRYVICPFYGQRVIEVASKSGGKK